MAHHEESTKSVQLADRPPLMDGAQGGAQEVPEFMRVGEPPGGRGGAVFVTDVLDTAESGQTVTAVGASDAAESLTSEAGGRLHISGGVVIDANHAGTEPQENSELYIYENGFDLLAGGGVDNVDNSAERQVYFNNGTDPVRQPIAGDLTVTITQQAAAVNSATGTIYIYFVAE